MSKKTPEDKAIERIELITFLYLLSVAITLALYLYNNYLKG